MTRRRVRYSAADWPPDLVLLDDEDGADIFAVMEFGGEARPRLVRSRTLTDRVPIRRCRRQLGSH
jgi:hypothetical protein